MKNKIDLVNDAFSMLLRTGVTVKATNADIELALGRLEDVMSELESRNMATGYNFENPPQPDSPSGLEDYMNLAVSRLLAVNVWPDFSPEEVNPMLYMQATQSQSNLSARLAQQSMLKYAKRMPLGSGNQPYQQYQKFYGDYSADCGTGCSAVSAGPTPPPFDSDAIVVDNLKLLASENTSDATGKAFFVNSFYAGWQSPSGGGWFVWSASESKANHNGVTVYAPEALAAWAGTQANISTLLNWSGSGSGVWVRILNGFLPLEMAGAVCDGVSNDRWSVLKWGQHVIDSGLIGTSGISGECMIGSGVSFNLNGSASFDLPSGLTFKAAAGFPAQKLFLINSGLGENHVFKWHGGRLNGENIPPSGAGQANDIFYFVAQNSVRCDLYFDSTYSGVDWLNSGADSHVFVSGSRNIRVEIGSATGALDAAVYVSGDFDGLIGDSCEIYGNYYKCNVAAIVKRRFKSVNIDILTTDCLNGGGTGGANITGFASAPGGDGVSVKVNSLRTERSAFLQATKGAKIDVLAREVGVSIPGYTSPGAFVCLLSGSSESIGDVVASGINPACTVNANFVAVRCEQRVFATGTYNPTDNIMKVQANGIGRSVVEDAVGARNLFVTNENGNTSPSFIGGATSTFVLKDASGYKVDDSSVRVSNGLRVRRASNAVNNLLLEGGVAGNASGALLMAEGADANIGMSIVPKGAGTTFIGGFGGQECLRVGKGGFNALEVPTVAAGMPVELRARGGDVNIDLLLTSKGGGRVRYGTHVASADAPVTGYIEIKDASGTIRKLAVIS